MTTILHQGPAASDATVYIGTKRPSDSLESNIGEALIREAVLRIIKEEYYKQLLEDLNVTNEVEKQLLRMDIFKAAKIDPTSDRIVTIYYFAGDGEADGKRFFSLSTSCTFSLKPPPGMMMSPGF